jgi:hypothetical protein
MTVKEFLIKRGYNYIDCTRNSKMLSEAEIVAYEKAEIDLIIESKKDDKQKTVEVKTFTKEIEKADLCIKVSTQYIDKEQQAQRKSEGLDAVPYFQCWQDIGARDTFRLPPCSWTPCVRSLPL